MVPPAPPPPEADGSRGSEAGLVRRVDHVLGEAGPGRGSPPGAGLAGGSPKDFQVDEPTMRRAAPTPVLSDGPEQAEELELRIKHLREKLQRARARTQREAAESPRGTKATFTERFRDQVSEGFSKVIAAEGRRRRKSRKRRKKSSRRRRSESRSWSSSTEDTTGSSDQLAEQLFRSARGVSETLAERARRAPGVLLRGSLRKMRKYFGERVPGVQGKEDLQPMVMRYLLCVVIPPASDLGNRNLREMKTLAWAIDELIRGNILQAADVLVQRLIAIENASAEGSWSMARFIELVPDGGASAMPDQERSLVLRHAKAEAKLRGGSSGYSPGRGPSPKG